MKYTSDAYVGAGAALLLTVMGATWAAPANDKAASVWPAMRPLGRDIQARGDPHVPAPPGPDARSPKEPDAVLTLHQALELALARSPDLSAAAHGVQAMEAEMRQAGAWPNPELAIDAEEFGGADERQGYNAAKTTVWLSQTVELGDQRGRRRRVALWEARRIGWDYEATRLNVLTLTKKAFVDVLVAQEQLALAEFMLAMAEAVRAAAEERVRAGKVPPLEETRAGIEVANARIARDRAQRDLETARKRLATSWGESRPGFKEVGGDLGAIIEVPPLEELAAFLDETPGVAQWAEEEAASKELLALAKAERLPDLDISAGISRFQEDGTYAGNAGLALPLPLFDRNTGGILAAQHRATRTEYERRAARLRVMTDLEEAYSRLATARAEALTIRAELLPGAQQAFDAARVGYREGKYGYLDVLDTQQTLGQVKARYLDVLGAYQQAAADVERVTGIPLNTIQ